jgi:hypothetical protein
MVTFGDIVKSLLKENFSNYGMKATFVNNDPSQGIYCYHCTPNINGILKSGIRRQWTNSYAGNAYGDGAYTTYTLESARLNWRYGEGSENHGMVKMICHSDLRHFVIFDPTVCAQVHGKPLNIDQQLSYIFSDSPKLKELFKSRYSEYMDMCSYFKQAVDKDSAQSNYTSIGARKLWLMIDAIERVYKINVRGKYIRGLVYSGRQDGNCLIPFDFASVEPIAYSVDGGYKFISIDRNSWKHTNLFGGNSDIHHLLKFKYDYFRTEGFINGYVVVGNRNGFQILSQELMQKNDPNHPNGVIENIYFSAVDGQTFNANNEMAVEYKGEYYTLKKVNFKSYLVYDMEGHFICNLNMLKKYADKTNMTPIHRNVVKNSISDDDLDEF